MKARLWRVLDSFAHWLHLPHRGWLCDRYDLALGMTRAELAADRPDARELPEAQRREIAYHHRGEVDDEAVTRRGWCCPHMSIVTSASATLGRPSGWCGCDMQPVCR